MGRQMDRSHWMNVWIGLMGDGLMNGWRMGQHMDEQIVGLLYGRLDGWTDEWMVALVDKWKVGKSMHRNRITSDYLNFPSPSVTQINNNNNE